MTKYLYAIGVYETPGDIELTFQEYPVIENDGILPELMRSEVHVKPYLFTGRDVSTQWLKEGDMNEWLQITRHLQVFYTTDFDRARDTYNGLRENTIIRLFEESFRAEQKLQKINKTDTIKVVGGWVKGESA